MIIKYRFKEHNQHRFVLTRFVKVDRFLIKLFAYYQDITGTAFLSSANGTTLEVVPPATIPAVSTIRIENTATCRYSNWGKMRDTPTVKFSTFKRPMLCLALPNA
jgi:hypothetical protein